MLKALIFDVDGTLAETEEAHRAAFNAAFAACGFVWEWDQARYGELLKVAGGRERLFHYIQAYEPRIAARANLGGIVAGLHKIKTRRYCELIESGTVAFRSGVADTLAAARDQGVRLALATTTSLANVDALIRATMGVPWQEVFEVVVAGEAVAAKKPAPDVYLQALRELNLTADVCVAVEDSAIGLKSARTAGLAVAVTPSVYTADDDVRGADLVTPTLAALGASGDAIIAKLRAVNVAAKLSAAC